MNFEQRYIKLFIMCIVCGTGKGKSKAVALQAWNGQEVKVYSVTFRWRHRGWQRYGCALSLPRRYFGWLVNATPQPLYPRERNCSTHCTGGWVCPRASMNWRGKLIFTGTETRDCSACSGSLYCFSDHHVYFASDRTDFFMSLNVQSQ